VWLRAEKFRRQGPGRGFGRQTMGLVQGRSTSKKVLGSTFQTGASIFGFGGNPTPNQLIMKESSTHCNKGKIDLPKTTRKIFNADMGVHGVIKGFTEETAVDQVSEGIAEDTNGMENVEFILGKSALTGKIFNKEMGVNGALEGFVVDKVVNCVSKGFA
jgi:hypothetical protein